MTTLISAGGVVFRKRDQQFEVQLIRDRFGKITLPKGKMEEGETVEQTALREIEEETGTVGRIVQPLDVTVYHYHDAKLGNVRKEVHYYLVEAVGGEDRVQVEEIGGILWMSPQLSLKKLHAEGYDNNEPILQKAVEALGTIEV